MYKGTGGSGTNWGRQVNNMVRQRVCASLPRSRLASGLPRHMSARHTNTQRQRKCGPVSGRRNVCSVGKAAARCVTGYPGPGARGVVNWEASGLPAAVVGTQKGAASGA